MAIIDDVINRNNKANSFYPASEEDLANEANNMPDIPEKKASDQDNKQPAEIVQPEQQKTIEQAGQSPVQQPPAGSTNKWGYSDEEMKILTQRNFTPERLEEFLKFDPKNDGNFMEHIHKLSVPEPTAPDEKKIKKARLVAGIGDALGMVSQMWSAGKGAHMKERDYNQSAISKVAEQEKNLRNIYQQQLDKYNAGLYAARVEDIRRAFEEHKSGRKEINDIVDAHRKEKKAELQAQAQAEFEREKLEREQRNKEEDRELRRDQHRETARHNRATESDNRNRTDISRTRTGVYVMQNTPGSGNNKNTYKVIFPAHPDDRENVLQDSFGELIKAVDMDKSELDKWYREALADSKFAERHPELSEVRLNINAGRYESVLKASSEKERIDIAVAKAQDKYNEGFQKQPQKKPPTRYRDNFSWDQLQRFGQQTERKYENGDGWEFEEPKKKGDEVDYILDSAIL